MVRRRIGATVAAMLVAVQLGSPLAAAEPTIVQLNTIKTMLADNDVAALQAYLQGNPELLEGDSQLSTLLRQFLLEARRLPGYLSDSPTSNALRSQVGPDEGSDSGDDDDGSSAY